MSLPATPATATSTHPGFVTVEIRADVWEWQRVGATTGGVGTASLAPIITRLASAESEIDELVVASTRLDTVYIDDYGVSGDGSDDTGALQAALNEAAAKRWHVRDRVAGGTYAVTGITIPPGLRSVLLTGQVVPHASATTSTRLVQLGTYSLPVDGPATGERLTDCEISIPIDLDGRAYVGIYGEGPERVRIHRCEIGGITAASQRAGIWIAGGGTDCTIERNTVAMALDVAAGPLDHYGILVQGRGLSYGGYYVDGSTTNEPTVAIEGFTVRRNTTTGGSIGIGAGNTIDSEIMSNRIERPAHRGISTQGSCHRIDVKRNDIREYYSSAVTMGSGVSEIRVLRNRIRKGDSVWTGSARGAGEAAINVGNGSSGVTVRGNDIDAWGRAGVYVGPDDSGALIEDNIIRGFSVAGVIVESLWTRPQSAEFYRYDYAALTQAEIDAGFQYAYAPLRNVTVARNRIGAGRRVNPTDRIAGIAITQQGDVGIEGLRVIDNDYTDAAALDETYVQYEATAGLISGELVRPLAAAA